MSPSAEATGVVIPDPIWVWGVPYTPLTLPQTLDLVDALIAEGRPGYFITANLNYAMLSGNDERLGPVNAAARFILADGMPIVWASRRSGPGLPERVAGSDLIFALSERAARQGHRVFLLGAAPGIADEAARALVARYPDLQIVGIEAPPFRPLTDEEETELVARVRAARPDILFVAFGQPKGEMWLARNIERLGVPVAAQVGASIDFAAGRVRRAPRWIQRSGLEWAFRLFLEPRRLAMRYYRNGRFLLRMLRTGGPKRGT
jgi:N-acetylglucosaminyldiphosphoundecaprenol N-acetyl-beta-D-mannosaminyltransferase